MNAPATIGKGRPGGHGGGGGGGGHHGGGHHGGKPHGGWNCCLFAKSYCKLPCYGKLCKENYSTSSNTKILNPGTQTCTVKCFPFGWVTCDPIPCQVKYFSDPPNLLTPTLFWHFLPIPNFSDTESATFIDTNFFGYQIRYFFRYQFFRYQIQTIQKMEKFRNREVSKPKRHTQNTQNLNEIEFKTFSDA